MGRPQEEIDPAEVEALRNLIVRNNGNLSQMARKRGEDRQTLSRRLGILGLLEDAAIARARAGVKGPRIELDKGSADPDAEKQEILTTIGRCRGYRGAAKELGISARTMIRKMRSLGITRGAIKRAKRAAKAVSQ